jgi:hypothetical protein
MAGCGDYEQPVLLGAGGARSYYDTVAGRSPGGAAIKIVASQSVVMDGVVRVNADRAPGARPSCYYRDGNGGGAGGSIWLQSDSLSGSGLFQSNGAGAWDIPGGGCAVSERGGGGSGGRIALHATSGSTFTGSAEAFGAEDPSPSKRGPAGTVFTNFGGGVGTLIVYNGPSGVPNAGGTHAVVICDPECTSHVVLKNATLAVIGPPVSSLFPRACV